jgi:cytoskeleton protein RodZ
MTGLGTYLSHLREERGLAIEEMARVTRVAPRYLEALEREDFTALPAPVFTKGYIRAYCQALDVPVEEALSRYSETAEVVVVTPTPMVAPTAGRSQRRSSGTLLVSFILFVGFGVALFAVALLLQSGRPEVGARRVESSTPRVESSTPRVESSTPRVETSTPPVEAKSAAVASSPPAASASPVTSAPSDPASVPRPSESKSAVTADARSATDPEQTAGAVPEAPPLRLSGVASPYRLVARAQEATWLRVRTADGRATEETVPAGEVREWISNRPFVVTIGNAAGVALELNGQKLPPLGGRGVAIFRLILPPSEP